MSAKTQTANNAFSPDLTLTPDQQELLMTALTSNRSAEMTYHPDSITKSPDIISPGANHPAKSSTKPSALVDSTSADTNAFQSSIQASPDSGRSGSDDLDKSPFLDYDFDETNIDWDPNGESLFGNLPGTAHEDDGDLHDKRKNHEDEKDGEENVSKRREGEDKSAKKPGRKPLTEPTTVRTHDHNSSIETPPLTYSTSETKSAKSSGATSVSGTKGTSSKRSRNQSRGLGESFRSYQS